MIRLSVRWWLIFSFKDGTCRLCKTGSDKLADLDFTGKTVSVSWGLYSLISSWETQHPRLILSHLWLRLNIWKLRGRWARSSWWLLPLLLLQDQVTGLQTPHLCCRTWYLVEPKWAWRSSEQGIFTALLGAELPPFHRLLKAQALKTGWGNSPSRARHNLKNCLNRSVFTIALGV